MKEGSKTHHGEGKPDDVHGNLATETLGGILEKLQVDNRVSVQFTEVEDVRWCVGHCDGSRETRTTWPTNWPADWIPPQAEMYSPAMMDVSGPENCWMNPVLETIPPLRLISARSPCLLVKQTTGSASPLPLGEKYRGG